MCNDNDIKTMKPRKFILNLSDSDIKKLCFEAGKRGITPEEIIENFVFDLVNGTYTNGSAERNYINHWIERCGFVGMEQNFIHYLLEENLIEEVYEVFVRKNFLEESIAKSKSKLESGIMKSHVSQASYTWKDLVNGDGSPCFSSQEEWENSVHEDIKFEQADLEAEQEYLSDIWGKFISWTDMEGLQYNEEIKKVVDWIENIDHLAKDSCMEVDG